MKKFPDAAVERPVESGVSVPVVQVPGGGVSPWPAFVGSGVQTPAPPPGTSHSEFFEQNARLPWYGRSSEATTKPFLTSSLTTVSAWR